jgi:hypothetical protein
MYSLKNLKIILFILLITIFSNNLKSQRIKVDDFTVLAFYTGKMTWLTLVLLRKLITILIL